MTACKVMDPRVREDDTGRGMDPRVREGDAKTWIPAFARMTENTPLFLPPFVISAPPPSFLRSLPST